MATAVASAEPASRRWRLRLPERLPDLKGKWLTLYTIVWAVMLPLSIVGATRGAYIILTNPTMWSPYGFSTVERHDGIYVTEVFSEPARATQLRPGDYVIAIDGWPVPRTAARAAARGRVVKADGSQTSFTIRKPGGETAEVRLTRSQATEHQRYRDAGVSFTFARAMAFVAALTVPLLFIPAAILLFIRCRRDAVPAALSLAFLLLASIINGGEQLGIGLGWVQAIGSISYLLLFSALFAFPSGRFEPRWTAIPLLLFILTLLIDWVFPSLLIDVPVGPLFTILILAALISRYRRVGAGPERLQLRWAFLGLVVGMVFMTLDAALGAIGDARAAEDPRWGAWQYAFGPTLGMLTFSAMALGLIISVLRYRLYDADAVIGRSAAYAVLTIGFVILFAASQKIIELMGQQYLGQNVGAFAGGIGAALAAVAVAPMHNRAQRWAERRFQNSLYRLRHGLPALVGDLRETSGVKQIAGATLDGLVDGIRASRAAMVTGGKLIDARGVPAEHVDGWLSDWTPASHDGIDYEKSDPLFPVRVPLEAEGHGRVGWLLVGPRPDGSQFGSSECDVIEEIAEPVARAMQVALARSEREQGLEERLQRIERGLEDLRRLLPQARGGNVSPSVSR